MKISSQLLSTKLQFFLYMAYYLSFLVNGILSHPNQRSLLFPWTILVVKMSVAVQQFVQMVILLLNFGVTVRERMKEK